MTGTGMGGTDQRSCATPYIQDCTRKVTTVCGAAGMDVAADWFERCAALSAPIQHATRSTVSYNSAFAHCTRNGGLGVNACVRGACVRIG